MAEPCSPVLVLDNPSLPVVDSKPQVDNVNRQELTKSEPSTESASKDVKLSLLSKGRKSVFLAAFASIQLNKHLGHFLVLFFLLLTLTLLSHTGPVHVR
jgi:hypothetical protein